MSNSLQVGQPIRVCLRSHVGIDWHLQCWSISTCCKLLLYVCHNTCNLQGGPAVYLM